MSDVLIVGGGVIGLSLAYELAGQGAKVRLVERGLPGREASWAGAGILPPAGTKPTSDPYTQLGQLAGELHPLWSARLHEETGVDNGFRVCGGIYLVAEENQRHDPDVDGAHWLAEGVRAFPLDAATLAEREPALAPRRASRSSPAAWFLPDEAQIRNPRHLKALALACARRGVVIESPVAVEGFETSGGRVTHALTSTGKMAADQVCVTSGPWSRGLVARLGVELPVRPVRGQMVLLSSASSILRSIVNDGKQYLVPRNDGRILVGSTEEEAGFDKRTTAQRIAELLALVGRLAPPLADLPLEKCWAGLRPGSHDDLPYLGRVPGYDNAYIATGHFRSGLHLSPATAVVMARLMAGSDPGIDFAPFRPDRA